MGDLEIIPEVHVDVPESETGAASMLSQMLKMLGAACICFAVVDLVTYYGFGHDITGLMFTPVLAIFVGCFLMKSRGVHGPR